MTITKVQLMRNPDVQPTDDAIAKALNDANTTYIKFINKLSKHNIQLEWRYYNDGNAWLAKGIYKWTGLRGGQNETTLFWLSIWDSFFKITIYIPEKLRTEVLSLSLDEEVKAMIVDSKQMGKLKYFPIVFNLCSEVMFESLFSLIEFKKNSK